MDQVDMTSLKEQLLNVTSAALWQKASSFQLGEGLQHGFHTDLAKKHIRLLSKSCDQKRASFLSTAMKAGMWTRQRLQDNAYNVKDTRCPLCHLEQDCLYHRVWQCQAAKDDNDQAITKSNYLIAEAIAQQQQQPAIWLRGFPTISAINLPSINIDDDIYTDRGTALLQQNGKYHVEGVVAYLDESGGKHSAVPQLRRAGWG